MVEFPGHSLRLTLLLSLSLTASYSAASSSHSIFPIRSSSPSLPPKVPRATPSDLLSLLGPSGKSPPVKPQVARELRSCLRFLVPFSPVASDYSSRSSGRRELSSRVNDPREENQLVWWPPEPVLDLARLAFDTCGDPGAIHRALDPSIIPISDVEDSKKCRCQLTRTPYGRRFINKELNQYLEFLFKLIAARGPDIGLNVSLNRYDFFHGHLFLSAESGRLGILFHAKEYPKYDKKKFPYNMGYCQSGSNLIYDDSMNLRNILWLAPLPTDSSEAWSSPGVLVVLDARPGGIIYRDFVPEYVDFVRTIYEDEFGVVAVDVNYLNVGVFLSFASALLRLRVPLLAGCCCSRFRRPPLPSRPSTSASQFRQAMKDDEL